MNSLSDFRKRAGLTIRNLSDSLGVVEPTIWRWEKGLTVPNALQAQQLAELYNVTMDELCAALVAKKGEVA